MKNRLNQGLAPNLYFWQDKMGREVDCIIDNGKKLLPVEIKAGQTISSGYFVNLNYWNKLADSNPANSTVIYAGDKGQKRSNGKVVSWKELNLINF